MEEHNYVYQMRPLVVPAVVFLIIYPFVLGGVHFFSKLPIIELRVLVGIYVTTALGILFLWVIGKSKRVQIEDRQIIFRWLFGKDILEPKNIRRVAFYFDGKGREIAQIRMEGKTYYVSECYFPFPELMSDLEKFIQKYDLRSNLETYTGLID